MSERSVSEEEPIEQDLSEEIGKVEIDEDDSEFEGGSEEDQLDYNDGFLVRDEEVDEEDRPRKHKKAKRHKDKRKKRKLQLDPDDIDIIHGDTLMKPTRPKTRKKPLVAEDLDQEEDDDIPEEPLNEVGIIPEEEDDENYDKVTNEQLYTALAIFGDDVPFEKPAIERSSRLREIPEEDKSQLTSSKRKKEVRKAQNLHDQVASSEYPERYLRKLINYIGSENVKVEMDHETNWMAVRLREKHLHVRPQIIKSVLILIREKKVDLPFIKQYVVLQMEDVGPQLIDTISEIHQSWFGYLQSLQALNSRILRLRTFQELFFKANVDLFPKFEGIIQRMKELPPQEVIDDYREYLNFYLRVYQEERAMKTSLDRDPQAVLEGLGYQTNHQEAIRAGVAPFSREYMLTPQEMADNIQKGCQVRTPGIGQGDPQVRFRDFMTKLKRVENEVQVLERVVDLVAEELSCQPEILKYFKEQYLRKAFISTNPKEKGKELLDIFHPLFCAKRIQRRPLSTFLNPGDMLWYYMVQAEKEGLIQIEIELSPNAEQEILSEMTNYYQDNGRILRNGELSEQDVEEKEHNLKSWNIVRSQVIKMFMKRVDSRVKTSLRRKLTSHAEKALVEKCSDSFEQMLLKPPKKLIENIADERVELTPKIMVLLINQNQAKQIHRQCAGVYGVMLGRNGDLINDFYLSNFLERRRLPKRDGTAPPVERSQARNEEAHKLIKQKIVDLGPEVIVIGANCLQARFLEDKLEREIYPEIERGVREEGEAGANFSDHQDADEMMKVKKQTRQSQQVFEMPEAFKRPQIIMETTHLPQIYSRSSLSQKEMPNLSGPNRVALSLGRFVQDPLSQILHNWKEDPRENKLLQLNLHSMQRYLDSEVLQEGLEKRAIKIVNQVGVELTTIRDYPHLSYTVPFISGFGPITSAQFLQKLRSYSDPLLMRAQIFAQTLLPESIFLNCASFVRVKKPYEEQKTLKRKKGKKKSDYTESTSLYHPFDQTRIDVQKQYDIAQKLCRKVVEPSASLPIVSELLDQESDAPIVEYVMANPYYLTNANVHELRKKIFEEEKDESSSHFNHQQQLRIIEFIIRELTNPFQDPRTTQHNLSLIPEDKHQKDIVLNMIKESPETFYTGMIVTATIFYVGSSIIKARLENGLECIIHTGDCDLPDQGGMNEGNGGLEKFQLITGRVKEIQYHEFTAKLNAKLEELSSHRGYIRAIWPDLDPSFMLQEEDVENSTYDPIKQIEKEKEEKLRVNKRYTPRAIMHPHFKNMTYQKAVDYLLKNSKEIPIQKQLNNFVFRPSSSGPDHLTLTWQFFRKNLVHLDIEEHRKKPDAQIGEILYMNAEEYESLDEIITRYIYPCTQIVQDTLKHRKFVMQVTTVEQMKQYIKDEQSKTPNTVQYNFAILTQFPQHVVLMYSMNQSGRVYVEYIKVKPRGFWFHDQYFQNLDRLVFFFKNNQSKPEYQKHAKKMKAPQVVFRERDQTELPPAEEEWKGAEKDWIATDVRGDGQELMKNELPKREKTPRQEFDAWGLPLQPETQNVQNDWDSSAKVDAVDQQLKREHRTINLDQPEVSASSWGAGASAAPASLPQISFGSSAAVPEQPTTGSWGQSAAPAQNLPVQESNQGWGAPQTSTNEYQAQPQPAAGGWGSTPQNTVAQPSSGGGGGWGSSSGGGDWGSGGGGNSGWGNERESSSGGFNDRKRDDRFGGERSRDNRRDFGDRGGRGGRGRGDRDGFRGRGDRDGGFRGRGGGRGGGYRNEDQGRSAWGNQRDEGSSGGWGGGGGGGSSFGQNESGGGGWNKGESSRDQSYGRRDQSETGGWGGGASNTGGGGGWGGASSNQRGQESKEGSSGGWGGGNKETQGGGGWGDSKPQQSGGWGGDSRQDQQGGWGSGGNQAQLGKRSWTNSGGDQGDGGYGGERKQKRFDDDDRGDSWGGRNRGGGGFGGRDDRRGGRGGRGGDFRGGRRGGDFRGGRGGRGGGRGRDDFRSDGGGFGGGRDGGSGGGWSSNDRSQQNRDSGGWGGSNQQSGGNSQDGGQSSGGGWGGSKPDRNQGASNSGWGGGGNNQQSGGWGDSSDNSHQKSGGGGWGGDQKQEQGGGWGDKKQQNEGGWGSGGGGRSSWN